jgi:hypothetical protein
MRARPTRRAAAAMVLAAMLVAGCEYGYSRSALEYGADLPPPPPRGYASVGYGAGWVSPGYFSFSYTYGYPYYSYSPYSMYSYDPWWSYPPRYAYPWYAYPYVYAPFVVTPAPRRTFRLDPGPSAPSPRAGRSKRRFTLP